MSKLKIEDGNRYWYNEYHQLHRIDGPAIEWNNGHKEWWINGRLHRDNDLPIIECILMVIKNCM